MTGRAQIEAGKDPFRIEGEFSIGTVGGVRERLIEWIGSETDMALDLSAVQVCDAAGLQLICSLARSAARRGRHLRISALSSAVEEAAAALGVRLEEPADD